MSHVAEARWGGECARTLHSADEAEQLVNDLARFYNDDGTRGLVITLGPVDAGDQLEVAVNIDDGRTSLRWLESPAAVAIQEGLPAHPWPVRVFATDIEGYRLLPPDQTRVTPGRALEAVREYLDTGTRPTCLTWNSQETAGR